MNRWYAERKINIHDQGLVIDETTGESIAVTYKGENAPLIAAVPEMLDALKEIIEYWDCGDDHRNMKAAIELGRQAVIKATSPD